MNQSMLDSSVVWAIKKDTLLSDNVAMERK